MKIAGFLLLMLFVSWYHPIHVSVTNIDLDPGEGRVDISVKLFADDFQDLIYQKYNVQLRITEQVEPGGKIESVNKYIGKSLQLEINGKKSTGFQFIRSEIHEEAIWLHYRYEQSGRIRRLGVKNTLMLEKFEDQTNLLIVSYDKKQNGYRMDNKSVELSFTIK